MGKSAVVIITSFIMILFIATMAVHVAEALIPEVRIEYPNANPNNNEIYHNPTPLKISVYYLNKISSIPLVTNPQITKITYSLDDAPNVTLTNFELSEIPYAGSIVSVRSTLYNLTEGDHMIHAYAFCADGKVLSGFRTIFSVDLSTLYPPFTHLREQGMSILSPLNQTYDLNSSNQIPLTYTINGEVKLAYYQLDDYPNQYANFFEGNRTLLNVPDGSHKIQIWVTTERGNSTQITYFCVNIAQTETVQPTAIQTEKVLPTEVQNDNASKNIVFTLIIVALTIVAVLSILVLRRRKA